MAAMILYPTTDNLVASSDHVKEMKRELHTLGLELEVVSVDANSAMTGETVKDAEARGLGAYFIVQIDRTGGQSLRHPGDDVTIEAGDAVFLVLRSSKVSAGAIFSNPKGKIRAGRAYV
jgi:Trk K+ transport system NAD-binding subunit